MTNPIVGIGELLWDIYPDGRKVAGGAPFNFAFHCRQLGHPAAIVSRVGDDELGRELRERVRELGLSDEYIQTDREHPTGTVKVALDAHKVPTYSIAEKVAWDFIEWNDRLAELAKSCRCVCFGTLAQRLGTPAAFARLIAAVRARKPPGLIVFDVNLRDSFYRPETLWWGFRVSDWRKLNDEELATIARLFKWRTLSNTLKPRDGGNRAGVAILTRGQAGCKVYHSWAVDDGEGGEYFPSETFAEPGISAKVVDTVGAGDAFTAAMVCLHLEGRPLRECARLANHYAARVCEHQGATSRIERSVVERESGLRS
jgi:fructokinase